MADNNDAGQQEKPAGQAAPVAKPKNNSKRKRPLIILALVIVVGVIGYSAYWFGYAQFHASTDDAYVHGNVVGISPQVSGTVVSVHAEDTDFVRAGEILVELDKSDTHIAVEQAKSNLAHTVRQVRQMFDQAEQMQATVALRKTALDQANRDYKRAQSLKKVRGISTEDFQHAQTALQSARASYKVAQHQLAASRSAIVGTTIAEHPLVRQAKSQLRKAWLSLQRTRIVAPTNGYVAQRNVQVGQQVKPGSKLMAVIPLEQVWVAANFKETGLTHVRIGQPVELKADLYGDYIYHGHVAGLAAGTGSAFSLLPAQNATGNWIKVVQRVPVRIAIDRDDLKDHPLRIGLSMSVDIDTHDRDGEVLSTQPSNKDHQFTSVYEYKTDKLATLIRQIVASNSGQNGE